MMQISNILDKVIDSVNNLKTKVGNKINMFIWIHVL